MVKGYVAARRGEREEMQDAHVLSPDMTGCLSALPGQVLVSVFCSTAANVLNCLSRNLKLSTVALFCNIFSSQIDTLPILWFSTHDMMSFLEAKSVPAVV